MEDEGKVEWSVSWLRDHVTLLPHHITVHTESASSVDLEVRQREREGGEAWEREPCQMCVDIDTVYWYSVHRHCMFVCILCLILCVFVFVHMSIMCVLVLVCVCVMFCVCVCVCHVFCVCVCYVLCMRMCFIFVVVWVCHNPVVPSTDSARLSYL